MEKHVSERGRFFLWCLFSYAVQKLFFLTKNSSFSSLLRLSSCDIAAISNSSFLLSTLAAFTDSRRRSRLLATDPDLSAGSSPRSSAFALRRGVGCLGAAGRHQLADNYEANQSLLFSDRDILSVYVKKFQKRASYVGFRCEGPR